MNILVSVYTVLWWQDQAVFVLGHTQEEELLGSEPKAVGSEICVASGMNRIHER